LFVVPPHHLTDTIWRWRSDNSTSWLTLKLKLKQKLKLKLNRVKCVGVSSIPSFII